MADRQLIAELTFETFLVDDQNQQAVSEAKGFADAQASPYRILLIPSWPADGCDGSTHLLHAVGHRFRQSDPAWDVRLVCAHADLVAPICKEAQSRKLVLEQWRSADVLLVDNVQCLSREESALSAFYEIAAQMLRAGRRLVLAGVFGNDGFSLDRWTATDVLPDVLEIRSTRPRWTTLTKGLARRHGLALDPWIASRISGLSFGNVRALEGFLLQLRGYMSWRQTDITGELLDEVIKKCGLGPCERIADSPETTGSRANCRPLSDNWHMHGSN